VTFPELFPSAASGTVTVYKPRLSVKHLTGFKERGDYMESQILQQILDELKELKANQSQTNTCLEKIETQQAVMSSRLDGIDSRFDEVDARFNGIDSRLDGVDARLNGIDSRFDEVDARFNGIDSRLDGVDARLGGIDSRLDGVDARLDGIDSRLDEHYQLLRALEHASEVHKADMDNLTHQVARLSQEMNAGFKELTEISKSLVEMYGEHEAEIRTIKRRF
jgi:chromosome segregation ATPase